MRRATLTAVVLSFGTLSLGGACDDASTPAVDEVEPTAREVLVSQPDFEEGDVWYVAAIHRLSQTRLPEWLLLLESDSGNNDAPLLAPPAEFAPADDEAWGNPIVWQFEVIASGLSPAVDTAFVDYALTVDGATQTLTVLQVTAPPELNAAEITEGLDPVFYVVLGDSDGQTRAVHFDHRSAGGRSTTVLELDPSDAEYTATADVDMFVVPWILPAFPIYADDHSVVVGAGGALDEQVVTLTEDGTAADVFFTARPDSRQVVQRWSRDARFFDVSVTSDRIAWVVDPTTLPEPFGAPSSELRAATGALETPEAIAAKFRRAIRIDEGFRVSAGTFESATPQEFEPWAGFWWPLKQAPTAFGWSRGSRQQRAEDPAVALRDLVRTDMGRLDELGAQLRTAAASTPETETLRTQYFALREQIETRVWDYIDNPTTGIVARLSRGEVDLTHVDDFAPLTKFGLYLLANKLSPHPFEALAWEVIKQYNPQGEGWWGKCNGWTAAAILTQEPRENLTIALPADSLGSANANAANINLVFEPGDLKALVSGTHYGVMSHFYGARYRNANDDRQDLYPDAFHRLVTYYIGEEKFPLAFDITSNEEVWNYPAYAYTMTITEGAREGVGTQSINRATRSQLLAVSGVTTAAADAVLSRRASAGRIASMDVLSGVAGIDAAALTALRGAFSPDGERRRFDVSMALVFSTDGVAEDHVDTLGGDPEGFTNDYTYTLYTDAAGNIISGASVWTGASVTEHPDFAWLPYANNARPAREHATRTAQYLRDTFYFGNYAPSENPFIYTDAMERLVVPRTNAPAVCNPEPDDCGPGLVCNPVDGTCGAAPVSRVCGGGASADSPITAANGNIEFDVCAGRESWYAVEVAEGADLAVELSFNNAAGDIDLELLSPSRASIGKSDSTNNTERVASSGLAAGRYLVRVFGYNGAANTVSMTVTTTATTPAPDPCGDAAYEPNETVAPSVAALTTSALNGSVCQPGDVDIFRVPADAGDVTVTLSFAHASGDLDLTILNASGTQTASSTGTGNTESAAASGGSYVRVYGYRDATGPYSLSYAAR